MAAAVPTEAEKKSTATSSDAIPSTSKAPGAFPETPGQEPADFSVKPIPASEGAGNPIDLKPGEPVPDPSTITSNTVQSTVRDDPELKAQDEAKKAADGSSASKGEPTFSVSPLPATAGAGNPVNLKPGEAVPPASEVTSNTVDSTVRTDKESYENSGAGVPVPPSSNDSKPAAAAGAADGGAFSLPPVGPGMIPESSLPMGDGSAAPSTAADPGVTVQSAAPGSTTAQLAAQVPLQPKQDAGVPDVVKESQRDADFAPEASANPEAVGEKKEVEQELLKEVEKSNESGEPAPTETAATSATAPAATPATAAAAAPEETKAKDPKSAAAALAAAESSGPVDSRDVSPMSKQPTGAAAAAGAAATGNGKAEPTTPTTPRARKPGDMKDMGRRMSAAFKKMGGTSAEGSSSAAGTPDSKASKDTKDAKDGEGKKKKRGLFGKIKDALK